MHHRSRGYRQRQSKQILDPTAPSAKPTTGSSRLHDLSNQRTRIRVKAVTARQVRLRAGIVRRIFMDSMKILVVPSVIFISAMSFVFADKDLLRLCIEELGPK
jgi:hypothetical protein